MLIDSQNGQQKHKINQQAKSKDWLVIDYISKAMVVDHMHALAFQGQNEFKSTDIFLDRAHWKGTS